MSLKYLATKDFATVTFTDDNGEVITRTVLANQNGYQIIYDGVTNKTLTRETALDILAPERRVKKAVAALASSDVTYDDNSGNFYYKTYPIEASMQERLSSAIQNGVDPTRVVRFLEKLYANPNMDVVGRLYTFMEKAALPITEAGDFVAYKIVQENYLDLHSGTISNAIGERPSVDRQYVDSNNEATCSRGLHVCSQGYLPHFGRWKTGDSRVVLCLVSPTDVCAIPRDYNDAKMRVCAYTVIGEIANEEAISIMEDTSRGFGFSADLRDNENFVFGAAADDHFDSSNYQPYETSADDEQLDIGSSKSVDTSRDDDDDSADLLPGLFVYVWDNDREDYAFRPATVQHARDDELLYRLDRNGDYQSL